MTHDELIERGKRWLVGTKRCWVAQGNAFADMYEFADVMGWTMRESHLIECKTSRADFRSDKKKRARRYKEGLGQYRWYMAPQGVIPLEELPDWWGLLEVYPHKVRVARWAGPFELTAQQWRNERLVVVRALATGKGIKQSKRFTRTHETQE